MRIVMPSIRLIKFGLCLTLMGYFGFGVLNMLTATESIDEYSVDYWSSRLARNGLQPMKGLMQSPVDDQKFGFLGFIRCGHFIYNRSLEDIALGESYAVVPMVPLLPLYVHALPKRVFGDRVFHLVHVTLLVVAFLFPWWACRRQAANRTEWLILGLLVLLTPAVFVNATYAMTDVVGLLGISLFSWGILATWSPRQRWLQSTLLIIGIILMVQYKPVGWVLLPWGLVLVAMRSGLELRVKAGVLLAVIGSVAGIMCISQVIYGSALWAGYHSPINQFLKHDLTISKKEWGAAGISEPLADKLATLRFVSMDQVQKQVETMLTADEINRYTASISIQVQEKLASDAAKKGVLKNKFTVRANILYGIPCLFLCYPLMAFLLTAVGRDLWQEARIWPPGIRYLLASQNVFKLVYLSAFMFLFLFYMFYNHSTPLSSYLSLTNPTFRYFMIPFVCLVWYVIAFRVAFPLKRLALPLAILSLALLLVLPNNLPQRAVFRIYSRVLQDELRRGVPENAVLVGAYKYDKYFDPERMPSYSFIAHQRNPDYQKCFEEYDSVLGDLPAIIQAVYSRNKVPIIIYPDMHLPDSQTVADPYADLDTAPLATIDMTAKFGPFGRFLPEDKQIIYVECLRQPLESDP